MSFADEKAFNESAKAIAAANNISDELARKYLSLIGDTPSLVRWEKGFAIVAVYEESGDDEADDDEGGPRAPGRLLAEIRLPINDN